MVSNTSTRTEIVSNYKYKLFTKYKQVLKFILLLLYESKLFLELKL